MVHFVAGRSFCRLRLRLNPEAVRHFHEAVEFVFVEATNVAAQLLGTGADIRGRDGYQTLSRVVEARVQTSHEAIAVKLREARPVIRKAILAAAFAWLRIQFPVLNSVSAVAAAKLLSELIASRKTV